MFDCHVHVTGRPVESYGIDFIHDKLKNSLSESGVNGFLGIVATGTLFNYELKDDAATNLINILKTFSTDYNLLCDKNGNGLKVVKALGGEPAIMFLSYVIENGTHVENVLSRCSDEEIKALKLYINFPVKVNYQNFLKMASDYGITTLLVHTPSDYKLIKPVLESAYSNDLQLILSHGCYDLRELMDLVRDCGFLADTSINPLGNILKWIDFGLEKQLVFGSDWPCSLSGYTFDWHSQLRELNKINKIQKNISKNKVII